MKKELKKYLIVSICIFCVICQISTSKVYAETIEEIKAETDFKTVEEDGEPPIYDFLIDADDLIENEELPSGIKTTIEDVIYKDEGLISVNFFGNKSNSDSNDGNSEKQDFIRNIVRNLYKIFLYIASAGMLVLLIYIGITMVYSGISLSADSDIKGKKGSPKEQVKIKKLMEQWIVSLVAMILTVIVINLLVGLSNQITSFITNDSDDDSSIIVYVKNSKFNANAPILTAIPATSSNDLKNLKEIKLASNSKNGKIKTKTVDYYFKTSLEGLFMFETQYDSSIHPVKNVLYLVFSGALSVFKWVIYGIFFVRMFLMAILSAFAPIIILKNAFDEASGNKSSLKKYIKVYLYLLFLKPAIAILYYLMMQSNVYLVNKFPFYIVFVTIVLVIMIWKSLKILLRNLRNN